MRARDGVIAATMAVAGAVVVAGCTTTIKYTPSAELPVQGKTRLRVAVFDFADRTEGKQGMHLYEGTPWKYDNIGSVTADAVANALRNCGQFQSVERIRKECTKEGGAGHSFDIAVAGEVKEFKTGTYPHPTVFINPICLGAIIGIPTSYGYGEGLCEARAFLLDSATRIPTDELFIQSKFGPDFVWGSWSMAWSERQKYGQSLLKSFETEFVKQLRQRLDGPLGQTLLAMDRSRSSSAGSGNNVASVPPLPSPPASAFTPTQAPNLPPAGNRFALVVGLSQYQRAGSGGLTNLAFAAADARAFRDALVAQGWDAGRIKCLTDAEATKTRVENELRYGPDLDDALVVLFWAGHGFPDPMDARKLFLACYETDPGVPGSGLRMSDVRAWLEERKARNVVILADACHAGGLIAGRGAGSADSARSLAVSMKPDTVPPGWVYLLGARTDEQAAEHPALQGGLFTRSLVEALGGAADGYGIAGRKDGVVTLGEIREYVRDKVKDKAFELHLSGAFDTEDYVNTGAPEIWNLTLRAPKE